MAAIVTRPNLYGPRVARHLSERGDYPVDTRLDFARVRHKVGAWAFTLCFGTGLAARIPGPTAPVSRLEQALWCGAALSGLYLLIALAWPRFGVTLVRTGRLATLNHLARSADDKPIQPAPQSQAGISGIYERRASAFPDIATAMAGARRVVMVSLDFNHVHDVGQVEAAVGHFLTAPDTTLDIYFYAPTPAQLRERAVLDASAERRKSTSANELAERLKARMATQRLAFYESVHGIRNRRGTANFYCCPQAPTQDIYAFDPDDEARASIFVYSYRDATASGGAACIAVRPIAGSSASLYKVLRAELLKVQQAETWRYEP